MTMPTCAELEHERQNLLERKYDLEGQINTIETDIAIAEGNILNADPWSPLTFTIATIDARMAEINAGTNCGTWTMQERQQRLMMYMDLKSKKQTLATKQGELQSVEADLADIQQQGQQQGCWA